MNGLKIFALSVALAAATPAAGQNMTRTEYIERFRDIAVEHAERYGIPASVKMAQGILESGNGNGELARRGNTHFNIKVKASDNWRGLVVFHDDDAPNEAFRAYNSPEESWIDHSEYLDTQPRYDSLFRHGVTDYRSWARGLKNAGYATDPLYAEKLIKVIEDNRLWMLDSGGGAIPDSGRVILSIGGTGSGNTTGNPAKKSDRTSDGTAETGGMIDPDKFVIVMKKKKR